VGWVFEDGQYTTHECIETDRVHQVPALVASCPYGYQPPHWEGDLPQTVPQYVYGLALQLYLNFGLIMSVLTQLNTHRNVPEAKSTINSKSILINIF
jgi:hypothetical protein